MDFHTKIEIPIADDLISHRDKLLMLGSCFSQNIGSLLIQNKFDLSLNPFGIIYNPASISQSIRLLLSEKVFTEKDIVKHKGIYQSFSHHGSFSHTDKGECLNNINIKLTKAREVLKTTNRIIITFGTSYVYTLKETKEVVSNCHKYPSVMFVRYRLSVDEICEDWNTLISELQAINPNIKITFTVSPIRHLRDGAHKNQLNKATLLLAINRLKETHGCIDYFPAYEIVLDELRDYRFYAEDMVHPTETAIKYIWERFAETYFSKETHSIIKEWDKIKKAIDHKPFNKETNEYQQFLKQTLLRLNEFELKHPYICTMLDKEALTNKITF